MYDLQPYFLRSSSRSSYKESMDNDSGAWNDDDNIEENDTSAEGSSSNASNTFDFDTWAEWYAWSSRNNGTEEAVLLLSMLMEEQQSHAQRRMPRAQHNIGLRGYQYIIAVLNGHPNTYYEMFRMEVYAFRALCDHLRRDVSLRDSSREVTVEKALGMFCYTVGHGVVQRNAANLFQHSVETINRHVYNVMRALCRLSRRVIKPSQTTGVMPYIEGNLRLYPWFEVNIDHYMIDPFIA
ncbi:uncharacterized protein LOC121267130 [Juglans microcarpa x Juglans regia]|uniref:uncharacterized protein LOC121267130 n=1 Tax=Juglans microcarpa x Juglans regia TaxID=2249226 RepID=UPI001B7E07A6|nr:uncharacterized protein LOC121267130 [Juglans microcarpa x Juglans regia]